MPLPSASRTSITTTSGWSQLACLTASLTLSASPTTRIWDSASSKVRTPWRTTSWSSTSSTRIGSPAGSGAGRCASLSGVAAVSFFAILDWYHSAHRRSLSDGAGQFKAAAYGCHTLAQVAQTVVALADRSGGVEAVAVVPDLQHCASPLSPQAEPRA